MGALPVGSSSNTRQNLSWSIISASTSPMLRPVLYAIVLPCGKSLVGRELKLVDQVVIG